MPMVWDTQKLQLTVGRRPLMTAKKLRVVATTPLVAQNRLHLDAESSIKQGPSTLKPESGLGLLTIVSHAAIKGIEIWVMS